MTATFVLALVLAAMLGACTLAVALAWRSARRNARRLEELTQLYWELRYEVRELQVPLEQQAARGNAASATGPRDQPAASGEVFVPLTSLKR